jgi:hypothetical protein
MTDPVLGRPDATPREQVDTFGWQAPSTWSTSVRRN